MPAQNTRPSSPSLCHGQPHGPILAASYVHRKGTVSGVLSDHHRNVPQLKPNLSFIDATLTRSRRGNDAIAVVTLYEDLEVGKTASYERDFGAELKVIDEEQFAGAGGAEGGAWIDGCG